MTISRLDRTAVKLNGLFHFCNRSKYSTSAGLWQGSKPSEDSPAPNKSDAALAITCVENRRRMRLPFEIDKEE